MTTEEIIEVLKTLNSGLYQFIAMTEIEALKKSRITGLATPDRYSTIHKLFAATVSLGNSYADEVNKQRVLEGKEDNFVSSSTYCFPVTPILWKHKTSEQFYLRVYPNLCAAFDKFESYTDAFGEALNFDDQLRAEYFKASRSDSGRQGLDSAVMVRQYKIENVKYLKTGNSIKLSHESIKSLL